MRTQVFSHRALSETEFHEAANLTLMKTLLKLLDMYYSYSVGIDLKKSQDLFKNVALHSQQRYPVREGLV